MAEKGWEMILCSTVLSPKTVFYCILVWLCSIVFMDLSAIALCHLSVILGCRPKDRTDFGSSNVEISFRYDTRKVRALLSSRTISTYLTRHSSIRFMLAAFL